MRSRIVSKCIPALTRARWLTVFKIMCSRFLAKHSAFRRAANDFNHERESGALVVHFNLQMRLSQRNLEQCESLKTRENQGVQTGQVGLASQYQRPVGDLSVWMQKAFIPVYSNKLPTVPKPSRVSRTVSIVFSNFPASQTQSLVLLNRVPGVRIPLSARFKRIRNCITFATIREPKAGTFAGVESVMSLTRAGRSTFDGAAETRLALRPVRWGTLCA